MITNLHHRSRLRSVEQRQHEGEKRESKPSWHYAQLGVVGIFDLQFEMIYTIYDAYRSATQRH